LKDRLVKDSTKIHFYYQSYAQLLTQEKNYQGALAILNEYDFFLKAKPKGYNVIDIIENILEMGKLHYEFKNYDLAVQSYDDALQQLHEKTENSTVTQTLQFKILKSKIAALNKLTDYQKTLQCADEGIALLNTLRPTFKNHNDKFFLIEEAFPLYEHALAAAYELYQTQENSAYAAKAFYFFERSKATLMLETLLGAQAEKFAGIPEALTEKLQDLRLQINYLEKKLQKGADTTLEDELFTLKEERRNLLTTIETDYKAYYNLKYNDQVIAVETLQQAIKSDEAYVTYFYGNTHCYSMTILKNELLFDRVPITEQFENSLLAYRDLVQNPDSSLEELQAISHQLYKTLFPLDIQKNGISKLVVIPDGILHHIPFETFVISKENPTYLIEDTAVSYGLSATLLAELKDVVYPNTNVIAFAPNFEGEVVTGATRSELLPLVHANTEVQEILKYFDGEAFVDEKATVKNFNDNIDKFGIVHFATHAILNDAHPDYSYLAFSENEFSEDHILYANDIYNKSIHANLVTLSACETGIGMLKRGEGSVSLTRSFFYSGASSIASTLWKVHDGAAAAIMKSFYKELSNGKSKDAALRNAKLQYIQANTYTKLSHPYYWSGFIVSGNVAAITESYTIFWIVLFSILVISGLLFVVKKYLL
jgi:CHAT domain-containing protein